MKSELILLHTHQVDIPLIGVSKCNMSSPGLPPENGYVLHFFDSDEKFLATQDDMRKFLHGETVFVAEGKEWNYALFENRMKPTDEQINSYFGL